MVTGSVPELRDSKIPKYSKELKSLNLDKFFRQFENWFLRDIRRLLKLENEEGKLLKADRKTYELDRPFVAAAILTCCGIDVLSAFRYGRKNENIGKVFTAFVKEYFIPQNTKSKKPYNTKDVYEGLRNSLLHGYSLGKHLVLSHENGKIHLNKIDNRTAIDVFIFYYDLEAVYKKYKEELLGGKHINEFNKRWKYAPLIEYLPKEKIKRPIFNS